MTPDEARAQLVRVIYDEIATIGGSKAHKAVDAMLADPEVVRAALGMCAVAMADSDCGWVVSSSVEEAGAWSTVPDGGWTRADT